MRPATLAVNLGFLFASFALGVMMGRSDGGAPELERQPVAGSSAASSNAAASNAAASNASPSNAGPSNAEASNQEQTLAAALPAPPGNVLAPAPAQQALSWGQVAARAQAWTAAVRADQNYGAGVVIDSSGLVLTNLHVVEGTRAITVTPFGIEPSPAQLVDSDADLDVALLRVPRAMPNAADLASSTSLAVGDEVLAVGSPRKMYFSVSRGMVSFPNRFLDGVEYIQTDLPINVGNSGGPLVDREGHVVGIVSFILRDSQGISFALPIDRALTRFAKHLRGAASAVASKLATDAPAAMGGAPAGAARKGSKAAPGVPCAVCPGEAARSSSGAKTATIGTKKAQGSPARPPSTARNAKSSKRKTPASPGASPADAAASAAHVAAAADPGASQREAAPPNGGAASAATR